MLRLCKVHFIQIQKIAKYTNLISWLGFYTQLRKGVRHNSLVGNFRRLKQASIIFLRKILKINKPLLPNKKKQMGSGEWLQNGLDEITFVITFLKWWCTYLSTYSKETNIYSKTVCQWQLWVERIGNRSNWLLIEYLNISQYFRYLISYVKVLQQISLSRMWKFSGELQQARNRWYIPSLLIRPFMTYFI